MRRTFVVAFVTILVLEGLALWAMAKNCMGNDCACGDTLVANWTLSFDAYCANVDQALKLASGVTFDCQGHTISGNVWGQNAGIRLLGGATLLNCHLTGFWYGANLTGANNLIQGGYIYGNADEGIHGSVGSSGARIYSVALSGNGNEQIYLNTVSGYDIQGNWADGPAPIYIDTSSSNYVYGNTFINGTAQIFGNGDNNRVLGNVFNRLFRIRGSNLPDGNLIDWNEFSGSAQAVELSAAGSGNHLYQNEYHGAIIRCTGGGGPNYIGVSPLSGVVQNDGSCVVY